MGQQIVMETAYVPLIEPANAAFRTFETIAGG